MRDGALGSNLDIQFFGYLLDVRLKLPINLQALLEISRSPHASLEPIDSGGLQRNKQRFVLFVIDMLLFSHIQTGDRRNF